MSDNSYNDFKNGIKGDIKETGASLFLIGGLTLLAAILFSAIVVVFKSDKMDIETRYWIGAPAIIISVLLILSKKIRILIAQIWLISLVAIPILFILFIIVCLFYSLFTQPLN